MPIEYAGAQGYLELSTNVVHQSTSAIECSEFTVHPFKHEGSLHIWNGHQAVHIPDKSILTVGLNKSDSIAPIWRNNWIYSDDDFLQPSILHNSDREDETNEKARTENSLYATCMRIPFIGMPTLSSFTRILEYISMMGGMLCLWHLIKHKALHSLKTEKTRSTREEERGTPLYLYRQYKRSLK